MVLIGLLMSITIKRVLNMLLRTTRRTQTVDLRRHEDNLLKGLQAWHHVMVNTTNLGLGQGTNFLLRYLTRLGPYQLLFNFLIRVMSTSILTFHQKAITTYNGSARTRDGDEGRTSYAGRPLLIFRFPVLLYSL